MTATINKFVIASVAASFLFAAFLMPSSASAQNVSSMTAEQLIQLINQLQGQLSNRVVSGTVTDLTSASTRPTISGTLTGATTASITISNTGGKQYAATVTASAAGRWSHTVTENFAAGTYTVRLTGPSGTLDTGSLVVNSQSSSSMSMEQLIALINQLQSQLNQQTSPVGTSPARSWLSATPISGAAPLNVTFTGASRENYFGGVFIDYGDGSTDSFCGNSSTRLCNGQSLSRSHTYNSPGTYTAKLIGRGEGPGSNRTLESKTITVTGSATTITGSIDSETYATKRPTITGRATGLSSVKVSLYHENAIHRPEVSGNADVNSSGRWSYSVSSNLAMTGTYIVELYDSNNRKLDTEEIYIRPNDVLPSCTIRSNKSSVRTGESFTLTWSMVNATMLDSGRIGSTATSGSKSFTSNTVGTERYEIYVRNSAGASQSCSVSVTVTAPVTTAAPTCTITADKTSVRVGETVTFSWSSARATSIDTGSLGGSAFSGAKTVTITTAGTHRYPITVSGNGGIGNCSVSVTATAAPTTTVTPNISSFTFNRNNVVSGESITYSWASTNTSSCDLRIAEGNNLTNIVASGLPTSGSRSFTPTGSGTKTYVLSCMSSANNGQGASKRLDATVSARPTISYFRISSASVARGGSVTLSWSASNARACDVRSGTAADFYSMMVAGSQPATGSVTVKPTSSTTYQLLCYPPVGFPSHADFTAKQTVGVTVVSQAASATKDTQSANVLNSLGQALLNLFR